MRDEKEIRELLETMKRYAPYITHDAQRMNYDNFMAGLYWCLNDSEIINIHVDVKIKEMGVVNG